VTSAARGAGNSVVAANVATALAAAQRSVALLDLDLRKPTQHLLLDGAEGPGAAAILRAETAVEPMLEQFLKHAVRPNLDVLAGGPPAKDAAELLASPRLAEMLDLLRADHAFVIVDAPALAATADAASIASRVDEVLLVVGRLPVDHAQLRDTRAQLEALGVSKVRLVLNRGRSGLAGALSRSRA
jgi:capsular exopolysaccharide synthesis family protein